MSQGTEESEQQKLEKHLRQIAIDIVDGKIFASFMIHKSEEHLISSVFMPLVFMDKDAIKQMQEKDPAFLYEYLSEAGPRAINGYPTFMSFRFVSRRDAEYMDPIMKDYAKKKQELLEGTNGSSKEVQG